MREKHVYMCQSAIDIYNESHFIPDKFKEKIASFLFEKICTRLKKKEIYILDAGIGHGGDILIPFLKRLKNNFDSVKVFGFDNSIFQLEKLKKNLEEANFKVKKSKHNEKVYVNENIEMKVNFFDMEFEENFFEKYYNKFDIIFSCFLLHHLLNWRAGLIKLLKVLKSKNSFFIMAERGGDIEFLDGNFKCYYNRMKDEKDSNKKNFICFFYNFFHRKSFKHFRWVPEISATDYKVCYNFVENYLFKYDLKEFKYKYSIKFEKIKDWIRRRGYCHFWIGIDPNKVNEILDEVEKVMNIQNPVDEITIKDSLKIAVFTTNKYILK
jgi:hypothetical protein